MYQNKRKEKYKSEKYVVDKLVLDTFCIVESACKGRQRLPTLS